MTASAGRRRILDTMTASFQWRGIDGDGIDLAVVQSGVARMTPCQRFRSRRKLVMAFLEKVNPAAR